MLLGIFADVHDHLDHLKSAVAAFNAARCQQVLFAGDLVSTISVPPLRALRCPFVGCFGDNEGNKPGLLAGISLVGTLAEPPLAVETSDGTRLVLAHMRRQLRDYSEPFDVAIFGHSHKRFVDRREGRLFLNPGETSGWSFGRPSAALLETSTLEVTFLDLRPE